MLQSWDEAPIGVVLAGPQEFYDGDEFTKAMAGIVFAMPDNTMDFAAQNSTTMAANQEPVQPQIALDAAPGQMLDVQGVQFTLPENWTAINDSPSDKIFESVNGRFTVLAFSSFNKFNQCQPGVPIQIFGSARR